MPLTPEDLQRIAARTLAHYDQSAQAFWEGTRDHDVSQNIAALLQYIEAVCEILQSSELACEVA